MGTPFDYPLSSRLDENDAIFLLENTFIPWDDVFIYGDLDAANHFFPQTGFFPRAMLHGCTRLAVKLEFIAGLMMQALKATGTQDYRGQQGRLGEVIAHRNLFWSLSEAMARNATPWVNGAVLANLEAASAYHILAPTFHPIVRNLIEQSVTSGLIYLNSGSSSRKSTPWCASDTALGRGTGRKTRLQPPATAHPCSSRGVAGRGSLGIPSEHRRLFPLSPFSGARPRGGPTRGRG